MTELISPRESAYLFTAVSVLIVLVLLGLALKIRELNRTRDARR